MKQADLRIIAERGNSFHTSKELLKQGTQDDSLDRSQGFHTSKELLKPVEFKRNYITNTL
ncbi:hypothetical protein Tmari_1813 [Thermotoga maritima MSB8]|nr:hypothetical protein Tmari_1813 [Thermotoga maritima MSB8]